MSGLFLGRAVLVNKEASIHNRAGASSRRLEGPKKKKKERDCNCSENFVKVALPAVEKLPSRMAWKFLCSPSTDDIAMEVLSAETNEVLLKVVMRFFFSACLFFLFVPKVDKTSASEGVLDLKEAGKFILRFDNSYSYWNNKTVGFAVACANPFDVDSLVKLSFGNSA